MISLAHTEPHTCSIPNPCHPPSSLVTLMEATVRKCSECREKRTSVKTEKKKKVSLFPRLGTLLKKMNSQTEQLSFTSAYYGA